MHVAQYAQKSREAFMKGREMLTQLGKSTLAADVGLYRSYRDFDAPIQTIAGHEKDLMAVAWLPDNIQACSASQDGTVRLWDVRTGQEIWKFEGHKAGGGATALAVSTNGAFILSGGDDKTTRLLDAKTGREIR
jgi:WD40 repeat protein